MFGIDVSKTQGDHVPAPEDAPEGAPEGAIISPDTRRTDRIPPRQWRTKKWPVLDANGAPRIDLAAWRFHVGGLVEQPVEWTWGEFLKLPRVRVFVLSLRDPVVAVG